MNSCCTDGLVVQQGIQQVLVCDKHYPQTLEGL